MRTELRVPPPGILSFAPTSTSSSSNGASSTRPSSVLRTSLQNSDGTGYPVPTTTGSLLAKTGHNEITVDTIDQNEEKVVNLLRLAAETGSHLLGNMDPITGRFDDPSLEKAWKTSYNQDFSALLKRSASAWSSLAMIAAFSSVELIFMGADYDANKHTIHADLFERRVISMAITTALAIIGAIIGLCHLKKLEAIFADSQEPEIRDRNFDDESKARNYNYFPGGEYVLTALTTAIVMLFAIAIHIGNGAPISSRQGSIIVLLITAHAFHGVAITLFPSIILDVVVTFTSIVCLWSFASSTEPARTRGLLTVIYIFGLIALAMWGRSREGHVRRAFRMAHLTDPAVRDLAQSYRRDVLKVGLSAHGMLNEDAAPTAPSTATSLPSSAITPSGSNGSTSATDSNNSTSSKANPSTKSKDPKGRAYATALDEATAVLREALLLSDTLPTFHPPSAAPSKPQSTKAKLRRNLARLLDLLGEGPNMFKVRASVFDDTFKDWYSHITPRGFDGSEGAGRRLHGNQLLSLNGDGVPHPLLTAEQLALIAIDKELDDWNFDVIELAKHTVKPLAYIGFRLMARYDLFNIFNIDAKTFCAFAASIEMGYQKKPYHNSLHGADVARTMHYFMHCGGMNEYLTPMEQLAAIVAGLIHDVDHPGVNNHYLIKSRHELAQLYNDQAVLENHHCAYAFRILNNHEYCNFVKDFTGEQYDLFRRLVIELVLATDMTRHFSFVSQFNTTYNIINAAADADPGTLVPKTAKKKIDYSLPETRLTMLQMAIKCSDLGHGARMLALHHLWSQKVVTEFFEQGDQERQRGLLVSEMYDRARSNTPKSQHWFLLNIVHPMFDSWTRVLAMRPESPCGGNVIGPGLSGLLTSSGASGSMERSSSGSNVTGSPSDLSCTNAVTATPTSRDEEKAEGLPCLAEVKNNSEYWRLMNGDASDQAIAVKMLNSAREELRKKNEGAAKALSTIEGYFDESAQEEDSKNEMTHKESSKMETVYEGEEGRLTFTERSKISSKTLAGLELLDAAINRNSIRQSQSEGKTATKTLAGTPSASSSRLDDGSTDSEGLTLSPSVLNELRHDGFPRGTSHRDSGEGASMSSASPSSSPHTHGPTSTGHVVLNVHADMEDTPSSSTSSPP